MDSKRDDGVMWNKAHTHGRKNPYHATENQLEGSKSQLLSVFSSGNLEARSDICNGNN